jgi:amino acid permease
MAGWYPDFGQFTDFGGSSSFIDRQRGWAMNFIRGLNRTIVILAVFVAFVFSVDMYLYDYAKRCLYRYAYNPEVLSIMTGIVTFSVALICILGGMHLVSWTIKGYRNEKKAIPDRKAYQQ